MRKLLLWSFLALFLLMSALTGYRLMLAPQTPPQPFSYQLKPGTSLSQVAAELEIFGVLKTSLSLKLLAKLNRLGGRIQSGTYRFSEAASPETVLARLISGDVEKASLTIPEGFSLAQIVDRMAALGYADRQKLLDLAYDPAFIKSLKINADSLEGYLFPETYLFTPGVDESALLRMLVEEFRDNISAELLEKAENLQLNLHQLVTLASIIEKETGKTAEMPLISAVFHNRLRLGIPLQTDPTVIYGIENFDGNLTRKHLVTPTPYNSYLRKGLPPGPIASPGLAALRAAAAPADSDYLYFVSRGDGSHQFSRTLSEHNQAVRQYQLNRRH